MTTLKVSTEDKKTVAVVLTFGIHAWLKAEAERKQKSVSIIAREIIERAMSEAERKDVA